MEGFSEELLRDHFTLYEGYVKNTNTFLEKLATVDLATPEGAEMKRRLGWEWNGMRLHELYFGNMSKEKTVLTLDGALATLMTSQFGGVDACVAAIVAAGKMRGIGWVVLSHDPSGNALMVTWINEHDVGHLAGTVPILVMDCFEHAYIRDYGIKRAEYIAAFIQAVDWNIVEQRLGDRA